MTGFGSFDNSTCKRVLDLLEPGDLRLGQVVIKRVAVVKLGVNNGSGDGGSCFGIEVWTDTAKLANMVIVLGPLLFAIYCSPVANVITGHGVQYHQYADDTQLCLALHADNTAPGWPFLPSVPLTSDNGTCRTVFS